MMMLMMILINAATQGTYAAAGASVCNTCPQGTYGAQDSLPGVDGCTPCSDPAHQSTSADGTQCLCPVGTVLEPTTRLCVACTDYCGIGNSVPLAAAGGGPGCTTPGTLFTDVVCACASGFQALSLYDVVLLLLLLLTIIIIILSAVRAGRWGHRMHAVPHHQQLHLPRPHLLLGGRTRVRPVPRMPRPRHHAHPVRLRRHGRHHALLLPPALLLRRRAQRLRPLHGMRRAQRHRRRRVPAGRDGRPHHLRLPAPAGPRGRQPVCLPLTRRARYILL